eukprot:1195064-Prorocentrum_minimum.AAC.4
MPEACVAPAEAEASMRGAGGECTRSIPLDWSLRRDRREPAAVAAALAKRIFVRSTPYLVTGCRKRPYFGAGGRGEAACVALHRAEPPPEPPKKSKGGKRGKEDAAGEGRAAAEEASGPFSPLSPLKGMGVSGVPGVLGNTDEPSVCSPARWGAKGVREPRRRPKGGKGEKKGSETGGSESGEAEEKRVLGGVLSSTERYRMMRRTQHSRITMGKSAIHGWGVFTKVGLHAEAGVTGVDADVTHADADDTRGTAGNLSRAAL